VKLDQKNQSHMYNRYQNTYEIAYFVINILNCVSKLQITILDYILCDFNDLNINHTIIVRDCTIMIFN